MVGFGLSASGGTAYGRGFSGASAIELRRRHKFEGVERAVVVAYDTASFVTRVRCPGPVKPIRREVAKRVGIGSGRGGRVRSVEFR